MENNYTRDHIHAYLCSFVTYNNCKDVLLEMIENNLIHKNYDWYFLFLDVLSNDNGHNVYYAFYEICYNLTFRYIFENHVSISTNKWILFRALQQTRTFAERTQIIDYGNSQKENPHCCNQLYLYNRDGLLPMDGGILCDFLTETNTKLVVMFWLENAEMPNHCFLDLICVFCNNMCGKLF